ncbi:ATP synthase F1 subunit delta [Tolypothrix sp. VBCCA 56010]|uniref:ATP synthase F1 subunit delta n=1 Tax=Tolypothrix sp. VBCCA 56010 TaxID=3137731 RepID=UPI003D7E54D7
MKSDIATAEIAQPYAQALMSVAESKNQTEEFGEDVRSLLNLLKNSPELQSFVGNPFIEPDKKKAVINEVVGDTNSNFRNFLMLLVDRRRILLLEPICEQYIALLRQKNQTVLAEITSTVPLSQEQEQAIREKVIAMTNARQVDLETKIDRDLIGGVIIKVGSQVIDASLRSQLRRLSLRLSGS